MKGRTVAESATEMQHVPFPDESNAAGKMHGGFLLKHIDTVGGVAAIRHARCAVVTASLDRMDFRTPVHPGELVILKSSVNLVGRTSMEVGVRVEVENLTTGEVRHAATCYLTYVAIDGAGRPREVAPLLLVTDEERRRHAKAARRRELRRKIHEEERLE